MFRIHYYIFGLDRKTRYIYESLSGQIKLSKEKTGFYFFGFDYDEINSGGFDAEIKKRAKEIYEKYKCSAYVEVEYLRHSSDTPEQIIVNNNKAVLKTSHFNHLFSDEYIKWLKSLRQ